LTENDADSPTDLFGRREAALTCRSTVHETGATPPGALYGALERAGEACSQWDEIALMHYTDRILVPIDCGGGWYCMTYCTLPVWAYTNE